MITPHGAVSTATIDSVVTEGSGRSPARRVTLYVGLRNVRKTMCLLVVANDDDDDDDLRKTAGYTISNLFSFPC